MLLFFSARFERWREKISLPVENRTIIVHIVELVDVKVESRGCARLAVIPTIALRVAARLPMQRPETGHIVAKAIKSLRR